MASAVASSASMEANLAQKNSNRDAGLLRVIGPLGMAAAIVNTVVGAGIFRLPASMYAAVGAYAPLAYLLCAVVMGGVVICFAEGGSRVPTSGGTYGYVEAAFGPGVGFLSGVFLWFSGVLALGGIAAAVADGLVTLLPSGWARIAHALVIIVSIGGVAALNIRGAVTGTRFIGVATLIKLTPLLIFLIAGATALHGASAAASAPSPQGFARALILAVFAFSGMETPLSASGEVREPERNIPRALIGAMLFCTVLYVAIQLIAQGVLGAALADSPTPLAAAMARISPLLSDLLLAGATLSMFGWMGSDILAMPRLMFAVARDGLLPAWLGRVHSRTHAPVTAIVTYAALGMILALTGTFTELVSLSALAAAGLYILGCAAAWLLSRRGVRGAGAPMAFRYLGVAAAVGIFGMLILIGLAQWNEILGFVIVVAVSLGGYALLRHRPAGH
jgi:basic amino acid/polyamine antiporter, APA family